MSLKTKAGQARMKPWIVGNWKMNTDKASARDLVSSLIAIANSQFESVEVGVAPPSIYLDSVVQATSGSKIQVGAQNSHFELSGAFTGEISPSMICDLGCDFVIVGHSERRHIFAESDEAIQKKVAACVSAKLKVILCVGETLEQRESGRANDVVVHQVEHALKNLTPVELELITIAYEPVWAIGTGKTATPEEAGKMHHAVRQQLHSQFGAEIANQTRILYGGSVKPTNSKSLLAVEGIDGALVGGASLKADLFSEIISSASEN